MVPNKHHHLYEQLSKVLGSKYVSDYDFAVLAYMKDVSPFYGKVKPGIIVKPLTTEEVSEIVKIANDNNTPVIPRGGGASAFGSPFLVIPKNHEGKSIVIDMTRMDGILKIDEKNMTVTSQCGITLGELETFVRRIGFHLNTVIMPFYTDTLGGVMSGITCGGIDTDAPTVGTMADYIESFKVVLPNGDVLQTGGGPGTNVNSKDVIARYWGSPDLTGLFIGDGGAFGIKTEATLRILPIEEYTVGHGFLFNNFEDSWKAISQMMDQKKIPYSGLMGFDPEATKFDLKIDRKYWSVIYYISSHREEDLKNREEVADRICRNANGIAGVEEAENYGWKYANAGWRMMGETFSYGAFSFIDALTTKSEFPGFYPKARSFFYKQFEDHKLTSEDTIEYTFIIPWLQHACLAGINIVYEEPNEKVRNAVSSILLDYFNFILKEGAISDASQGIGADIMSNYWSPTLKQLMNTLKKAIDPNNILNPALWKLGL
ncbi:MAG: FAD-binding oxidoreductase [Candidatus Hodarchaeota archaeon]